MTKFEFEEKKPKGNKDIEKNSKDLITIFTENKTVFYSVVFYAAGLLCGAYAYKKCQNNILNDFISSKSDEFLQLFLNNLSIYLLIFVISVLLGVCLVGFPFINLIPLAIGFESGMKVSYYYINYSIKGIGYSLIMVAPFVCLFLSVIIYSISMSYDMSKKIYEITIKKTDITDFEYKLYLKKYLIYACLVLAVALINTAVSTALSGIISI